MIVMAPSDDDELVNMVATVVQIDDGPVCFRCPRGAIVGNSLICKGMPLKVISVYIFCWYEFISYRCVKLIYLLTDWKGKILGEGKDIAFLGYKVMVENCLKARSLLFSLGIQVTVVDAIFCKPLDIKLVRQLCEEHEFLITDEGSVDGLVPCCTNHLS
ncbi:hypothetical protein MKX03_032459 [Papaver bracteatum]|nr:hypothetical protein MKX03_032459 [Papaver bracteatum]